MSGQLVGSAGTHLHLFILLELSLRARLPYTLCCLSHASMIGGNQDFGVKSGALDPVQRTGMYVTPLSPYFPAGPDSHGFLPRGDSCDCNGGNTKVNTVVRS